MFYTIFLLAPQFQDNATIKTIIIMPTTFLDMSLYVLTLEKIVLNKSYKDLYDTLGVS
jgi:hypothetical protein